MPETEVKVVYTALGKDRLDGPDYTQAAVAIGNPPSRYTLIPRLVSPLRWEHYAHGGRVAARHGIELSHAVLPEQFDRNVELGTSVLGVFGFYEGAGLDLMPAIFATIGNGERALVALSRTESGGACIEMHMPMDNGLSRSWNEAVRGATIRREATRPDEAALGRARQRLVQMGLDAENIGGEYALLYAGRAAPTLRERAVVVSG